MNPARTLQHRKPILQRRAEVLVSSPAATGTALLQRRVGNSGCLPLVSQGSPVAPQPRLMISSPADAAEREAESVGKQIARMPAPQAAPAVASPAGGLNRRIEGGTPTTLARRPLVREGGGAAGALALQRVAQAPRLQRHTRADGSPAQASSAVSQEIAAEQSGGEALPGKVRQFMEPRFGADFGNVKIHTDARAARLAQSVQAQAFTVGGHIFFGAGQFNPDGDEGKQLIAHELTHTIQQGAARQSPASAASARSGASERPAGSSASAAPVPASMPASMPASRPAAAPPARAIARAPATLARSPAVRVNAAQSIQRWGLPSMQDVRDFFADKARYIPGYTLLTVIMGWNPISGRNVERSGVNILRALVECIPAGPLLVQVLEANGMMQRGGVVAEREFGKLTGAVSDLTNAFGRFIDSLNLLDLGSPSGVWERAKAIFVGPIDRLISAGTALVGVVLELVKQAVLQPLARLAQPTRAWDLLCAVLGKNPITGEAVPRNPQTLIGGFMKLIGQEEVWANIQRANAIPRAWAWFQAAMSGLIGLVSSLPQRFMDMLTTLTLRDFLTVVGAFAKVVGVFARFVVDFLSWAGNAVWELLKIIFEVVAPGAMPYLKKVGASLREIFKNPLPFVRNLARAGKLGFDQFKNRFGTHLKNGIIQWLTGSLPGIYIPAALNLQEILKFVLSVLGISWAAIRVKLVRAIGEPAVVVLENGFEIVKILVTQGPAAAWDKIKEHLTNLKDMAMNAVKDFIVTNVVTRATAKIASLLIPGAGFISAIVSIWDMIQVFISQMQRIAQVGKAFLDSVMDIASGALGNAANKVESVLANLLTLAINFLAGFVGLGGVAGKVMNVINTKIRPPIDKAMDKLVEWIVNAGRRVVAALTPRRDQANPAAQAAAREENQDGMAIEAVLAQPPTPGERTAAQKDAELAQAKALIVRIAARAQSTADVQAFFPRIIARYRMRELKYVHLDGKWVIRAQVNPVDIISTGPLLLGADQGELEKKNTEVKRTKARLGGSVVATMMEASLLGPNHPMGSPPGSSEQTELMNQLPVDPKFKNENKYIRGHLLNDNLGGPGIAENMFPITAAANKAHLTGIETQVKKWVNSEKRWVYYKVSVTVDADNLSPSAVVPAPHNRFVDATMKCTAWVRTALDNTEHQRIDVTITSRLGSKIPAAVVPDAASAALPLPGVDAAALALRPHVMDEREDILNVNLYNALNRFKAAATADWNSNLNGIIAQISGLDAGAVNLLNRFLSGGSGAVLAPLSIGEMQLSTKIKRKTPDLLRTTDSFRKNYFKQKHALLIQNAFQACVASTDESTAGIAKNALAAVTTTARDVFRRNGVAAPDVLSDAANKFNKAEWIELFWDVAPKVSATLSRLTQINTHLHAIKVTYGRYETEIPANPAATKAALDARFGPQKTAAAAEVAKLPTYVNELNTIRSGVPDKAAACNRMIDDLSKRRDAVNSKIVTLQGILDKI